MPAMAAAGSVGGDKKPVASHSIISSLKRLVSDVGNNNGIGNTTSASSECREELDGVERGEGTPLSHLTASRAKAPRRRPPSSQHLRHHAAGSTTGISASPTGTVGFLPEYSFSIIKEILIFLMSHCNKLIIFVIKIYQDENMSNGQPDTLLEQIPDEETDGLTVKARKKAPWVTYRDLRYKRNVRSYH